eukprot:3125716-Rhodomonas_salina.2
MLDNARPDDGASKVRAGQSLAAAPVDGVLRRTAALEVLHEDATIDRVHTPHDAVVDVRRCAGARWPHLSGRRSPSAATAQGAGVVLVAAHQPRLLGAPTRAAGRRPMSATARAGPHGVAASLSAGGKPVMALGGEGRAAVAEGHCFPELHEGAFITGSVGGANSSILASHPTVARRQSCWPPASSSSAVARDKVLHLTAQGFSTSAIFSRSFCMAVRCSSCCTRKHVLASVRRLFSASCTSPAAGSHSNFRSRDITFWTTSTCFSTRASGPPLVSWRNLTMLSQQARSGGGATSVEKGSLARQ